MNKKKMKGNYLKKNKWNRDETWRKEQESENSVYWERKKERKKYKTVKERKKEGKKEIKKLWKKERKKERKKEI